jgi:5-formyltetrahydrofolate cyclo-ligase
LKPTIDKPALRQHFQLLRNSIPPARRTEWNHAIRTHLLAHPLFEEATHLFTYLSFRTEVDTRGIIEAAMASGKSVSIPRLKGDKATMEAVPLHAWADLVPGPFGLLEPAPEISAIPLPPGTLVLVPGLAFDPSGHRLGYGGGYYDRFLARPNLRCIGAGLAYEAQITQLPHPEAFDQRVDWIVTELGWKKTTAT